MIQYYLDLEKQVKAVDEAELSGGQIQKIYSTSYLVSFSIRSPGKTWHLYLGRGNGYEGIWLHDQSPTSKLRRKDTFLEYLRKHVSSCGFIGIQIDSNDRIITFQYQKFGEIQSLLFFWKARSLYFVHHYQEVPEGPFKLLLSWHGRSIIPSAEMLNLYECFDEVGRKRDMLADLHSPKPSTILEMLDAEKNAAEAKGMITGPGFLQRKLSNIESDLAKTRQWEKMQTMLDDGTSLDGIYELKVGDHKVKFEGELNPYERRNLLFQKIKKLKRGEDILSKRRDETKELLEGKQVTKKEVSDLAMTRPIWGKEPGKVVQVSKAEVKDDYRVFKFDAYSVGVGLSSQGNDQLRNKWAGKEDTWIHLDGAKSAHAIIKLHTGSVASSEALNMAATIVAHFSHFNSDWVPIIFTAVKNLKGVAGAPGMVIYKKEKHLTCPKMGEEQWLKE